MVTVMMVTQSPCPTQCTPTNSHTDCIWFGFCLVLSAVLSPFVEWSLECWQQTKRLQQSATQYAEIPSQLPGISLFDRDRSLNRKYVENRTWSTDLCGSAVPTEHLGGSSRSRAAALSSPSRAHKSPLPRSQGPLSMR